MGRARDGRDRGAARAIGVALKPVTLGTALAVAGTLHAALNSRLLRRPVDGPVRARISVLIPARDEATRIVACLDSIDGADEVLVLDDGSSDGTAAIAAAHGARVLTGTPPPPGWLGKPHACAQLAAAASGDVLVFLDADVRLRPGAVRTAVHLLESTGLDLVSPHPRQEVGTLAERLVQPLLQWSILTTLPLRLAERSPRPSLAAANGQFLVVRREAYERAGGHVRDAVLDDLALLRAIKRSGGRGGIVDGTDLAACRMYEGWAALREGYGKSLWAAFGTPAGSVAVLGGLGLAYVLPALAAVRGSRIGLLGYAAGVAGRMISAWRTGGRVLDSAAHPVSIAVLGYLTARSHLQRARGTLQWRGRPV
ncbi:MAG TPA: glycosyltransferase family 2 protein [Jatrophihabitans sp.]